MQEPAGKIKQDKKLGRVYRALKYIGYGLVFIIAMQLGQLWMQRDVVVGRAPVITALDIDGRQVSLADYKGEPVLLYFWASWCPICRFEHSVISELARDYQVLSIAMQSGSATEVKAYMQEHNVAYRVINDADGEIAGRYGLSGVPTSFVIDSSGNIRAVLSGYTTGLSLRYRLWRLKPDSD